MEDMTPETALSLAIQQKRFAESQLRIYEAQKILADHQIELANAALQERAEGAAQQRDAAVAEAQDLADQAKRTLKAAGVDGGLRTD